MEETATVPKSLMENLLGLLRIRVKRGVNLAVRDVRSSDPYLVIKMYNQVLFFNFSLFFITILIKIQSFYFYFLYLLTPLYIIFFKKKKTVNFEKILLKKVSCF